MTEKKKKILSIVVTAVVSVVVGICGVFGIQVVSGCTTTGSVDWNGSIERVSD